METEYDKAWRALREGQEPHKGRVAVLQGGRAVGTVPGSFAPSRIKSGSLLYDPRPGDFRRGEKGWIADPMLGLGDLEAIPGFTRKGEDGQA